MIVANLATLFNYEYPLHAFLTLYPASCPVFVSLLRDASLAFSLSFSVSSSLPLLPLPPVHPETQSLAVLAPLQDVVVGAGDAAVFECLVSGPPDVDVDWMWRGRLLQPALLQCKMHFDGRKCKLLLTSVHEDDSGVYTCKLSTAKGKEGDAALKGQSGP